MFDFINGFKKLVPGGRLELPHPNRIRDFKSLASTCSATRAMIFLMHAY